MADTTETLPDLKANEVKEAQKQGALDHIREAAKTQFATTDGAEVGSDPAPSIIKTNDALNIAHMLDLDPKELKAELTGKGRQSPVPTQGQIASLVEMERSGKNRDDVVEVLCEVLGIKSPYEVTDAGPAYTNVVGRKVLQRG